MLNHLSKILELTCPDELRKEANKKLAGSFMLVNGELTYIVGFTQELIEIDGDIVPWGEVESLEVYLPECGTYKNKSGSFYYVGKNTTKQWRKSFNSDLYYIVNIFGEGCNITTIKDLIKTKDLREDTYSGTVYYNLTKVVKEDFLEELKEMYG